MAASEQCFDRLSTSHSLNTSACHSKRKVTSNAREHRVKWRHCDKTEKQTREATLPPEAKSRTFHTLLPREWYSTKKYYRIRIVNLVTDSQKLIAAWRVRSCCAWFWTPMKAWIKSKQKKKIKQVGKSCKFLTSITLLDRFKAWNTHSSIAVQDLILKFEQNIFPDKSQT